MKTSKTILATLMLMAGLALAACGGGGGGGGDAIDEAAAPVSGGSGGGGSAASDPADEPADDAGQTDDGTGATDGEIPDGTDTTGGADGTVPAATVTDQRHIVSVLHAAAAGDEAADAAFDRVADLAEAPGATVLYLVEPALDPQMADAIADALGADPAPLGPDGIACIRTLAAAARRAEAARRRNTVLDQEIAASGMAADATLIAARAEVEAMILGLEQDIDAALADLPASLPLGADVIHTAVPAVPADDASVLGMAALDAAVVPGILVRARADEHDAMDLIITLYDAYDAMLTANPVALPNTPAVKAAVRVVRDEIRARRDALAGLRLVAAAVDGQTDVAIVRTSLDVDQGLVDYQVDGPVAAQPTPDGLILDARGITEPVSVRVTARHGDMEESLEVRLAPADADADESDPEPDFAYAIHAHVVDELGEPVPDAHYELREVDEAGPIARDLLGRDVAGDLMNPDGEMMLPELAEGDYYLILTAGGRQEIRMPVPARDRLFPVVDLEHLTMMPE